VEFAKRVSAEQARLENVDEDLGIDLTEEEEYLQKLDAGLATLEHLTLVFAHLWATDHAPIMRRLYLDASQNAIALSDLRDILRQHAHHVGDSAGDSAREGTVRAILSVLPYAPGEREQS
jgi:beta-catenin-like protein 1